MFRLSSSRGPAYQQSTALFLLPLHPPPGFEVEPQRQDWRVPDLANGGSHTISRGRVFSQLAGVRNGDVADHLRRPSAHHCGHDFSVRDTKALGLFGGPGFSLSYGGSLLVSDRHFLFFQDQRRVGYVEQEPATVFLDNVTDAREVSNKEIHGGGRTAQAKCFKLHRLAISERVNRSGPGETARIDMLDCVGEIANIVAGNIMPYLRGNNTPGQGMTLPSTFQGVGVEIWKPEELPVNLLLFETMLGRFAVAMVTHSAT